MKEILQAVKEYAALKHDGQFDKAGLPYINHPLKVSSLVSSDNEKIVAWLHDVLEDTDATIDEIRALGVPEECIEAIQLLTHDRHEPYLDYIRKIKENKLAKAVKWADLTDNSDLRRLPPSEWKSASKRQEKYMKALEILDSERNDNFIYFIKKTYKDSAHSEVLGIFEAFEDSLSALHKYLSSYNDDGRFLTIFRTKYGLLEDMPIVYGVVLGEEL